MKTINYLTACIIALYLLTVRTYAQEHDHSNMKEMKKKTETTVKDKAEYITKDDPRFQKLGVFNTVCPVVGGTVSLKHPKILYKGKIYGFCCAGCDKKFMKNPAMFMKNLSPDGKKFLGKKEH